MKSAFCNDRVPIYYRHYHEVVYPKDQDAAKRAGRVMADAKKRDLAIWEHALIGRRKKGNGRIYRGK